MKIISLNLVRIKKAHQRFRCIDCGKTFSTITNSLFSYSKKEPYQWFKFIESLFHGDTIKQFAQIVGICEYTFLYGNIKY